MEKKQQVQVHDQQIILLRLLRLILNVLPIGADNNNKNTINTDSLNNNCNELPPLFLTLNLWLSYVVAECFSLLLFLSYDKEPNEMENQRKFPDSDNGNELPQLTLIGN